MIPIADIWHPPLGICYTRQKIVNAQDLPLGRGWGAWVQLELTDALAC